MSTAAERDARREALKLCTMATCSLEDAFFAYRPDLAANVILLVLFSISFLGFVVTYAITRRAPAFTFAMVWGTAVEVIGYGGRIWSWQNPWLQPGFLMQICCLSTAPAFLAAGIYLCLRKIVYAFGPGNSRISPEAYTRIFIPCDLLSLILQATGGALASVTSQNDQDVAPGTNVMIAGLVFQVFTLLVFMVFCADFAYRTYKRYKTMGEAAFDQDAVFKTIRSSWRFKGFLIALTLATICIFWRSVFRVAELSEGWRGELIKKQWLFFGFEGVLVIVACLGLNIFHPAFTFKEGMDGLGGLGAKKKLAQQGKANEELGTSGNTSDIEAQDMRSQKA